MELDKLQETDEEIPWALNCPSFRIFFKCSLHRSEKCLETIFHIVFSQTLKYAFVESDGIYVFYKHYLSFEYPQYH